MKTDTLTEKPTQGARFTVAIVILAFVALALMPGCRNGNGSDSGTASLDEGLFSEMVGMGAAATHWDTLVVTTSPPVSLVFFEDGTGQASYGSDGFARGAGSGVVTRTLYTMTWEVEEEDEVTISLDGNTWEFDIVDISVGDDDDTFSGKYIDDEGEMDFDFTRQMGAVNL